MQILLTILAVSLIAVAYLAVKFILGEEKEKKKKEKEGKDAIAGVETTLGQVQAELVKEKADKEEIETLLYKVKDEADKLKTLNNELNLKLKDALKSQDTLDKNEEALKQESIEKEKLATQVENLKKLVEQAKKESAQQPSTGAQDIEPLKKENEELKNKLKLLEEVHEGLKGQYDELSKQL